MKEEGGRIRLQEEITQTNQIVLETDRKLGIKTGGQETSRTTNKTDPGQKCLGAMQARNRRMVIGILHRNSLQPRRTLTLETSLTATSFSNLHSQCPSLTLMYRLPHFFSNTTTSCQIKGLIMQHGKREIDVWPSTGKTTNSILPSWKTLIPAIPLWLCTS